MVTACQYRFGNFFDRLVLRPKNTGRSGLNFIQGGREDGQ